MAEIRVLVCDDQMVVQEGLQMILDSDAAITVVGLASDGFEALQLIPQKNPNVVLMDLKMPGMNGIRATREIRQKYPDLPVLILTTFGDDEWLFDAIRSGASGYLLKDTPRQELIAAVKGTVQGDTYIDPSVGGRLLSRVAHGGESKKTTVAAQLSEREHQVLGLLAKGFSNHEIAESLHLTEGTVRNYVSAILAKLEVKDRTQAVILALTFGLVD